jgi:energy-coupling factor transporter ATP-binding protein EcfA2
MQFVSRNDEPAPACLSDQRSARAREVLGGIFLEDKRLAAQSRIAMSRFAVEDAELQLAVERLFNGRCAFCDAEDSIRPYRIRPAEEAGPSGAAPPEDADRSHLYYTWLVNAWQNIYAICPGCDPAEPSIFPVSGRRCHLPGEEEIRSYIERPVGHWRGQIRERPLFLDPCGNEDYRRNLACLPNGIIVPLSSRGEATVHHFSLNRTELAERRARRLLGYFEALLAAARERDMPDGLFAFSRMEFGGDWFLLLYQMAKRLGGGGGSRPTLSRLRIDQYYRDRLLSGGSAERIEEIHRDLLDDPEQVAAQRVRRFVPQRGDARPVRFVIENFKALERVEIDLAASGPSDPKTEKDIRTPALVILGENAAGKSSILEAIALALAPQDARDDLSLDAGRFMLNPAFMGLEPGSPARKGKVAVHYEDGTTARMRVAPGFTFGEGAELPRIPVFAYGAFRLYLKVGKRPRASSPIRSLFEASYVLPNPEVWLATLRGTPLFEEVARALKLILAVNQSVDLIEMDGNGACSLVMTDQRGSAAPVTVRTPFSAVSSGFRSVLAMVCDVMRGIIATQDARSASLARARAVVLIDEIEAHLHPRWKMQIIQGLRAALPNVTFIMTTHDPLCLRGLSSDEVRVFRRVRRESPAIRSTLPTFVEQLEDLPVIGSLTVEQLLTSDLFQLHTTDAPELESALASAGDLLAREAAGDRLAGSEAEALDRVRREMRAQIGKAMPIGSTDVERLIQEAVEEYLVTRRSAASATLKTLRDDTRNRIIAALAQL